MAQLGFNAGDYDPTDEFETLPAGEYVTMITEATIDSTKSGGRMVKLTYTVMDGQYQGRKIWSNHNIENRSPKAEEIGRKELSRIAHAIGQPMISDTDQLLNQVMTIRLIIKQDPGYGPQNEVKKWFGSGNGGQQQYAPQQQTPTHNPPPAQQPAHQPPAGHPAAAHTAPPWGNK